MQFICQLRRKKVGISQNLSFSTQESYFPLQLLGKGIRLISLCYTRRYLATQWSWKQSAFKAASSLHLIEWLRLSGLQRTPTMLVNRKGHKTHSWTHTHTHKRAARSTPVPRKQPRALAPPPHLHVQSFWKRVSLTYVVIKARHQRSH